MGRRLLWMRVWRGTHGGLWYPLREDVRFEARVHPHHLQISTATHIFLHAHCAACCTHRKHPHTPRSRGSGHPGVIWHRKVPPSGLWVSGNASTWQWLLRARKERRGLLVVTGTAGRTSCGTPERLRPSTHLQRHATAHSAARFTSTPLTCLVWRVPPK